MPPLSKSALADTLVSKLVVFIAYAMIQKQHFCCVTYTISDKQHMCQTYMMVVTTNVMRTLVGMCRLSHVAQGPKFKVVS